MAEQVFLDNFSCYLPAGERFFVESVRYFEDKIKSDKLREEVKKFYYQEVQHSISHSNFNKVLFKKNKLARISERYIQFLLVIARKALTRRLQLSITSAAEHFTAIISNWLLVTLDIFFKKSGHMAASMWVWHAIEEVEHKSVAFDVLIEVTPNKYFAYFIRVMGMLILTIYLIPAMLINMPLVYLGNRYHKHQSEIIGTNISSTSSPAESQIQQAEHVSAKPVNESMAAGQIRGSSIRFFLDFINRVGKAYIQYYYFSFHPWQHDNSGLLNAVKTRLKIDTVIQRLEY